MKLLDLPLLKCNSLQGEAGRGLTRTFPHLDCIQVSGGSSPRELRRQLIENNIRIRFRDAPTRH